jgi:hypothetical protein
MSWARVSREGRDAGEGVQPARRSRGARHRRERTELRPGAARWKRARQGRQSARVQGEKAGDGAGRWAGLSSEQRPRRERGGRSGGQEIQGAASRGLRAQPTDSLRVGTSRRSARRGRTRRGAAQGAGRRAGTWPGRGGRAGSRGLEAGHGRERTRRSRSCVAAMEEIRAGREGWASRAGRRGREAATPKLARERGAVEQEAGRKTPGREEEWLCA